MISQSVIDRANEPQTRRFPIKRPELFPGVVPARKRAPVLAMDGPFAACYDYAAALFGGNYLFEGFPGYQYLAQLAVKPEYRSFADTYSSEITREWITIRSTSTDKDNNAEKITELTKACDEMNLKGIVQQAAIHDSFYGRGQVAIDIEDHDRTDPFILDKKGRTLHKGQVFRLVNVEPMWTSPLTYNALDPLDPWFYKPRRWWMLGQEVHATRLLTITTREVPDMLKPAFNFSGISMSQLAEPYVNNWLRTRSAVSDMINMYSIIVLATHMDQVLQQGDAGGDLFRRVDLFNALRSNKSAAVIDKDSETLESLSAPLGGLHELQAQAQEGMCTVSRTPATELLGVAPSGFGNVSEGERKIRAQWIHAQQNAFWSPLIKTALELMQLSMYGSIDPDITYVWNPLETMTAKEKADIRKSDAEAAGVYIDRAVIAPEEERERIARDPESGYEGLDLSVTIESTQVEEDNDNANVDKD
jgi:hypothetical protein